MIEVPNHRSQGQHRHHLPDQWMQYHTLAPRVHHQLDTSASSVHDTQGVLDTLWYTHVRRNTLFRFLEYRDRVTLLETASVSTRVAWVLS